MTDIQARVMESLARGRLIFPQKSELNGLRETGKSSGLTNGERARLDLLESVYSKVREQDQWFHSAMLSGNIESARQAAEKALATIKEAD
mgnify:FL=1